MCYNPACPQIYMPAVPQLTQALEKAMLGEAEAIKFYFTLASMAPDQKQKDVILGIREDEKKHLNNFQATYCAFTGHVFQYPEPNPAAPSSYRKGLQKSFEDEQEAYEFYKKVYFAYPYPMVKHSFMDAFLDEAEHARWFLNLLIRNE